MDITDPKTSLQKLLSRKRGILARLRDPSVLEGEKVRARMRLAEVDLAIQKEQDVEVRIRQGHRYVPFKVEALS